MEEKAIAVQPYDKLKNYMRSDDITQRFAEVVGNNNAAAFISSVLIAVSSSDKLQACSIRSIVASALRAATLRLSCDPGLGQAHLVPFKGQATLIIGYRGLYDMCIRTGRYRYLNVSSIYDGMEIVEDPMTGKHKLEGFKKSNQIVGYLLYFELVDGFSKTFYMSCDEIMEHARQYSKSFTLPDSLWKKEPHKMMRKTVLRVGLSRWGYLDPNDAMMLTKYDEGSEIAELPEENEVEGGEDKSEVTKILVNALMGNSEQTQPAEEETIDGTYADMPELAGAVVHEPAPVVKLPAMSYAMASEVKNSDGELYILLNNDTLANMIIGIGKGLRKPGITDAQREEYQFKLSAIRAIQQERAK